MANDSNKVVDSSGTIHQRGFDSQYRPKQGVGGPDRDLDVFGKPNVERDVFGNAEPKRDIWGHQEKSAKGRPLYQGQSSGSGSTDWDGIFGFIFWVLVNLIMGIVALVKVLIRAIQSPPKAESDDDTRRQTMHKETEMGESSNSALILELSDQSEYVRWHAVEILTERHKAGSLNAMELAPTLPGASLETRFAIIRIVSQENAKDVVPLFARIMETDPEPRVRSYAANLMRWSRSADAVEPLIRRVKSDPESEVRASALASLGDLLDWRAYETAVQALRDEDAQVRKIAIKALVDLETFCFERYRSSSGRSTADYRNEQTQDMVPPTSGTVAKAIASMLGDKDSEVRKEAIVCLRSLVSSKSKTPDAVAIYAIIRIMAANDPDAQVRVRAKASLPNALPDEIECYYCRYLYSPYNPDTSDIDDTCPNCKKTQPDDECEVKLVSAFSGHVAWVALRTQDPRQGQFVREMPPMPETMPTSDSEWIVKKGKELVRQLLEAGWQVQYTDHAWESQFIEPYRVHYRLHRPFKR